MLIEGFLPFSVEGIIKVDKSEYIDVYFLEVNNSGVLGRVEGLGSNWIFIRYKQGDRLEIVEDNSIDIDSGCSEKNVEKLYGHRYIYMFRRNVFSKHLYLVKRGDPCDVSYVFRNVKTLYSYQDNYELINVYSSGREYVVVLDTCCGESVFVVRRKPLGILHGFGSVGFLYKDSLRIFTSSGRVVDLPWATWRSRSNFKLLGVNNEDVFFLVGDTLYSCSVGEGFLEPVSRCSEYYLLRHYDGAVSIVCSEEVYGKFVPSSSLGYLEFLREFINKYGKIYTVYPFSIIIDTSSLSLVKLHSSLSRVVLDVKSGRVFLTNSIGKNISYGRENYVGRLVESLWRSKNSLSILYSIVRRGFGLEYIVDGKVLQSYLEVKIGSLLEPSTRVVLEVDRRVYAPISVVHNYSDVFSTSLIYPIHSYKDSYRICLEDREYCTEIKPLSRADYIVYEKITGIKQGLKNIYLEKQIAVNRDGVLDAELLGCSGNIVFENNGLLKIIATIAISLSELRGGFKCSALLSYYDGSKLRIPITSSKEVLELFGEYNSRRLSIDNKAGGVFVDLEGGSGLIYIEHNGVGHIAEGKLSIRIPSSSRIYVYSKNGVELLDFEELEVPRASYTIDNDNLHVECSGKCILLCSNGTYLKGGGKLIVKLDKILCSECSLLVVSKGASKVFYIPIVELMIEKATSNAYLLSKLLLSSSS